MFVADAQHEWRMSRKMITGNARGLKEHRGFLDMKKMKNLLKRKSTEEDEAAEEVDTTHG